VTQIFRIAQEAITNAVKHAKPKKIVVGFDCAARNTITLTVRDDGIGRKNGPRTKGGLGTAIMSYRARTIGGTLTVSDGEGGGTVVTCTAPCEVYSKEDSKL
jgi:signal transduction histidine kinase